ncbi:MAG: hypothetical protein K0R78_2402 [Pelosinus sp.]|jgi:hypothetical protein|nr:hypothetical protein [Pelosinus sp.]
MILITLSRYIAEDLEAPQQFKLGCNLSNEVVRIAKKPITSELHPNCWTVHYTVQQLGCNQMQAVVYLHIAIYSR